MLINIFFFFSKMLHAENTVRLLECQDEIRIEPSSKRMKSTEGACEKLPDDDSRGTQEKVDDEKKSNGWIPMCALDQQGQHEMRTKRKYLLVSWDPSMTFSLKIIQYLVSQLI